MNLKEKLINILETAKEEIISNIREAGETASGRTERSLQVVERDGHIMLIKGEGKSAPMSTLEIGREAGAVPYNFTEIILEWMKDKGISAGVEKENKKMAGAIAWGKIRKEGTNRHKNPRYDIYSNVTQEVVKKIQQEIPEFIYIQIKKND